MNRKGPWEGYRRQAKRRLARCLLPAFLCAHIFIERETSGYEAGEEQSVFLRIQVRASSQTKGLERGWKRRARLGRDARLACETRAFRARKTLTLRFTYFFTDFEKINDCFAVCSSFGTQTSKYSTYSWWWICLKSPELHSYFLSFVCLFY